LESKVFENKSFKPLNFFQMKKYKKIKAHLNTKKLPIFSHNFGSLPP
jgi:hypothetical protein